MKRIKYIILTIFVVTTFSCGDDFLEKNPLSFLSPENTFVDARGAKKMELVVMPDLLEAGVKDILSEVDKAAKESTSSQ